MSERQGREGGSEYPCAPPSRGPRRSPLTGPVAEASLCGLYRQAGMDR